MRVFEVTQHFPPQPNLNLDEILARLNSGLDDLTPRKGRIAIGVGSRKIPHYPEIIRAVVARVKSWGGTPEIHQMMGSHGAGTGEGQAAVLREHGIDESTMDCRFVCTMETEKIGTTEAGYEVHCASSVLECDGLIVIGRVGEHPSIQKYPQSCVSKLITIGIARLRAEHYHYMGEHREGAQGLDHVIRSVAGFHINYGLLIGGVGIVDNSSGGTANVDVLLPKTWFSQEEALHDEAMGYLAGLPFSRIPVLWLAEMGKDVVGSGVHSRICGKNARGEFRHKKVPKGDYLVGTLCISALQPSSHGNANGIWFAEYLTSRLASARLVEPTMTNANTAGKPELGYIRGQICADDHDMLWRACGGSADPGVVLLRHTKSLGTFYVTEAMLGGGLDPERFTIGTSPIDLPIDSTGHISLFQ